MAVNPVIIAMIRMPTTIPPMAALLSCEVVPEGTSEGTIEATVIWVLVVDGSMEVADVSVTRDDTGELDEEVSREGDEALVGQVANRLSEGVSRMLDIVAVLSNYSMISDL